MKALPVCATLLLAACGGPVGIEPGRIIVDTGLAPEPTRGGVQGAVVDAAGRAVPGAYVFTEPRGIEARTDQKGRFELPWLPPGELILVAGARGWEAGRSELVEVVAGEIVEAEIVLAERLQEGVVVVSVAGPEGEPLEGAVVSVSDGSSASTDADGVARLEGVSGQDLSLEVAHEDGWSRSLEGVTLTEAGGLQWSTRLSGRSDGEVDSYGNGWCELCHAEIVESFAHSPHGRAFVREPGEALRALFDAGTSLALGHATATLLVVDEIPSVLLEDVNGQLLEAEVVGFIGDPDRQTVPMVTVGGHDFPLPLAFFAGSDGRAGHPCGEARLVAFETERWFDAAGGFAFEGDAPAANVGAVAECLPCHVSGFTLTALDGGGVEFGGEEGGWRDDGVACERCHGPGESHLYSMSPMDIVQPWLLDGGRANEVCGQCHGRRSGMGAGLPHPHGEEDRYEPGDVLADTTLSEFEAWSSGAAAVAHAQHDELLSSAHGPEGANLRCVDCHGVHGGVEEDAHPHLLRGSVDDNGLCESCHLEASFASNTQAVVDHMGHRFYAPDGSQEAGRCLACHMPATASDGAWCEETGSGSLSSHLFVALAPQFTVEVFDEQGVDVLAVGDAPPHACIDCHHWNDWYFDGLGLSFPGVSGDPTLVETHESFQASYEEILP